MMGFRVVVLSGVILLGLAACAETQLAVHVAKSALGDKPTGSKASTGGKIKIGKPYEVKGVWYYPKRQPSYNETGIASWYGEPFHGRKTANGERYDMNALTAAHKTLPMPSRVRVTNLGNGRSIELRVNDRGPFAHGRIIDVSRRGAQLLGFQKAGTAKVRVSLLDDDDGPVLRPKTSVAEREALPALPRGTVSAETLAPPQGATAAPAKAATIANATRVASAPPRTSEATEPATGSTVEIVPVTPSRIFVQAGAFLRYDNANRLRARLASLGPTRITTALVDDQEFFRVRLGPIVTVPDADRVLGRIIASGIKGARIVVD